MYSDHLDYVSLKGGRKDYILSGGVDLKNGGKISLDYLEIEPLKGGAKGEREKREQKKSV